MIARILALVAVLLYFGGCAGRQSGGATRAGAGQGASGRLPFANDEPAIDGMYNSGYEESLYSPFSMN